VAGSFFGLAVSGCQLLDLTRDLEIEYRREAGDTPELLDHADDLRREVLDLRLSLGEDTRRGPWRELVEDPDSIRALETVRTRAICTPPSTPCGGVASGSIAAWPAAPSSAAVLPS